MWSGPGHRSSWRLTHKRQTSGYPSAGHELLFTRSCTNTCAGIKTRASTMVETTGPERALQFFSLEFQRLMELQHWGVASPCTNPILRKHRKQAATKREILASLRFPAVQCECLCQNVNKLLLFLSDPHTVPTDPTTALWFSSRHRRSRWKGWNIQHYTTFRSH